MNKIDFSKIFDKKDVILKILCAIVFLSIFVKLTFLPAYNEASFYDTGYAWYLSKIMTFGNFIDILRAEGHFIVWYLIIMPFAKLNLFYPYSIQMINWVICFSLLVYLWKKSPFDALMNGIITLSFIMLNYYAIIARCYSVGVLGLFLVASLYKNSIKKPILYSVVIGLTANTSIFAAIPAAAFALIFFYDVYKEQLFKVRNIKISLMILFFLFGFALFPFMTGKTHFVPCQNLSEFLCISIEPVYLIPFLTFLIVSFYILFSAKTGKIKFLYMFSILFAVIFLLFCYKGELYHRFIFIIYAIVALWADGEILIVSQKTLLLYASLAVLLLFRFDLGFIHVTDLYKTLGLYLQKSGNEFENSIIIIPDKDFRYTLLPYAANNGKITIFEFKKTYTMGFETDLKDEKIFETVFNYAKSSAEPVYVFSFYELPKGTLIRKTEEDWYENAKLYIYKLNAK